MLPPTVCKVPIALLGAVTVMPLESAPALTVRAEAPDAYNNEPAPNVRFGVLIVIAPPPLTVWFMLAANMMPALELLSAAKVVPPPLVSAKVPVPARVKLPVL